MKYGRWITIFALFALVIAVDLIAADLSEKEQDFLDSIESGYLKDFQKLLKERCFSEHNGRIRGQRADSCDLL